MYQPVNDELAGQLLGIVGLGASGAELATRARALGMRVQAVDVAETPADRLAELGVERFTGLEGLDELLASSDYVSLHIPLGRGHGHLLDERRLRLMKPNAALVNVARGRLVDEDALVAALRERRIRGAGISCSGRSRSSPTTRCSGLDNVIATPHTAGVTRGMSRRRSAVCVENARRVLRGEEPLYVLPAGA